MLFRENFFSQLFLLLAALLSESQVVRSLHTISGTLQHLPHIVPGPGPAVLGRHSCVASGSLFRNAKRRDTWRLYSSSNPEGKDASGDFVVIDDSTSLSLPPEASLTFPRVLVIAGQFTGNIGCTAPSLHETGVLVQEGGELRADVTGVETVEVFGKLVGKVECEMLVIRSSGEVIGDVGAVSLTVEPGGTIIGMVQCGIAAWQQTEVELNPEASNSNRATANTRLNESKLNDRESREHIPFFANNAGALGPISIEPVDYNGRQKEHKRPPQQSQQKPPRSTEHAVDSFGNPLVRGASDDTMDSIRRNRELVNEARDILDPSLRNSQGARQKPKKKEALVDDFGNPLIRGANDDEVNSLRRNRELVKEAREMMDRHKRGKGKMTPTHLPPRRVSENRNSGPDKDSRDSDLPPFLR